jgi:hypothetical protein
MPIRRLRVFLRLVLWWFPRLVIFFFAFNPPILHGLDPTATALAVLVIDGALAAFFLLLFLVKRKKQPVGRRDLTPSRASCTGTGAGPAAYRSSSGPAR